MEYFVPAQNMIGVLAAFFSIVHPAGPLQLTL